MDAVDQSGAQPKAPEQAHGTDSTRNGLPPRKNIVVCCDGTGNEFAGAGAKNANSNVVKLYTALHLDETQYAYYHPGVGTMGDPTRKGIARGWSVITGLAFGSGFEEHVLDAYRYLMQHYNHGDTVFLFGFSRGSYCARALAGLLNGYGLLCRGNEGHLPYAWRAYTKKVEIQLEKQSGKIPTDYSFRDTFCHKDFMIRFVGLFDTVSSVGWVSSPLQLLHLAQNSSIMYGRHAVSIDERRCFYQDNLWGTPVPVDVPPYLNNKRIERGIPDVQDIKQVWFSGVHSDVGGSYAQDDSYPANITLNWMLTEAEQFGLQIRPEFRLGLDPSRRKVVLAEPLAPGDDPNDELASLVPIYTPPTSRKINVSLTWKWWALEIFPHRYYTNDDQRKPKLRIPLGDYREIPYGALVHQSVVDRWDSDASYRPPTLNPKKLEPTEDKDILKFLPGKRKKQWRENMLIVLLVGLIEIALGLVIADKLLHLFAWSLSWTIDITLCAARKVLSKKDCMKLTVHLKPAFHCAHVYFVTHWCVWRWLWPFVLAIAIVILHRLGKRVWTLLKKIWARI
jgi:uncharacterized protein (DUF2235 family)